MRKILIQNGLVYDGSGREAVQADVLLEGDRIAALGHGLAAADAVQVDAAGCFVTPGFVDIHRHCDIAPITQPDFGSIELAQGITTAVGCNCGLAPLPSSPAIRKEMYAFLSPITGPVPDELVFASYAEYTRAVEATGLPLNMGFLVAAGAVKTAVKGYASTPYTPAEIREAAALVQQGMQAGALGVSLGIMYQPENFSTAQEIAEVVRPAAESGGLLTAHIRGEGNSLVPSVQEVIELARQAGMRLNISHFKATGIHNWRSKIFEAIECIENARAKGQPVTADFYPYDGGSTSMQSLIPPAIAEGGTQAMLKLLSSPEGKQKLRKALAEDIPNWDNMAASIGWDRILIASVSQPSSAGYPGKTMQQAADMQGYACPEDFMADLLVQENGSVGIIVLSMCPEDIEDIARLPWTCLISDSLYGGGANPHPRLYGSFPKFLREFVWRRPILSMAQAVHKMTGLPAARMGIQNRGLLQPGFMADVAVFSQKEFRDNASYASPVHLATGMRHVFVNGRLAWNEEARQPGKAGQFIRKA